MTDLNRLYAAAKVLRDCGFFVAADDVTEAIGEIRRSRTLAARNDPQPPTDEANPALPPVGEGQDGANKKDLCKTLAGCRGQLP